MTVVVNNDELQVAANTSIHQMLQQVNIPSLKGLAVAVNNQVIPKKEWDTYALHEKDQVTLIRATQGG